jgi:hypothetical protein
VPAQTFCVNSTSRRLGHSCVPKSGRLRGMATRAGGLTNVIIPGTVAFRRPPARSFEPSLREHGATARSPVLSERSTTKTNTRSENSRSPDSKPPAQTIKGPPLRLAHIFMVQLPHRLAKPSLSSANAGGETRLYTVGKVYFGPYLPMDCFTWPIQARFYRGSQR